MRSGSCLENSVVVALIIVNSHDRRQTEEEVVNNFVYGQTHLFLVVTMQWLH